MELHSPLRQEYRHAAAFFDEMDRLRRIWERFQPPPPLRRGDMGLLSALTRMEATGKRQVTVGQLARQTHQSPPSISQKVSELERQGYLARKADPADRRAVFIRLTAKGRTTAEAALRDMLSRMEQLLETLGEKDTDQLLQLMGRLGDTIEQVARETPIAKDPIFDHKGEPEA